MTKILPIIMTVTVSGCKKNIERKHNNMYQQNNS